MAECLVLGAGMVGVSTALSLQARGHAVTLIDRTEPGRETSYGNAGIIQSEAVEPYAMPLGLADLIGIAMGRHPEVRYSARGLTGSARALMLYAWNSRRGPHGRASRVYAGLIAGAARAHDALIGASGAEDLVRRSGWLELYRSDATLEAGAAQAERLRKTYGVWSKVLDSNDLAALEPALRERLAGAVMWPDSWSCIDPGGLVSAYAALFVDRGGQITIADASDIRKEGAGWRAGNHGGQHVVVAMGPWSPTILRRFGLRVPMVLKRGYHRHYEIPNPPLRPMFDTGNAVVMSPMRQGLRIATAADLRPVPHPAPPQLARGEAAARALFDLGAPIEHTPWTGQRPCMPDMLPVIGAVPGQPGLWANFGHGHQGFTLGPVTGEMLAEQIDGATGSEALSPARFA
ncbi:FAD-binding oxidoreductase [Paracoccus sp. TK19116]|uniref:FAD-binding oxidoreductase n=1 Tax=Paracoccus albicereus TaxID=2922394 RepID=A0ABT1MR93_9RHOB|nr:FAD-dependent oxidoreductase [Paracoccus albicereus]MCQ0970822.1 FAD-binding oxidoreductase [Paracoccus albicereus]